jgi:ATP-dependent exoDNAse (exonuclease V) alpha subunit
MIDLPLLRDVLCALPDRAQLILVGDQDQLPSVGPGNVFRDLIGSARVKVINLNRIFRQAEASLIVVNAHRVNQGQMPQFKTEGKQNFFFIEEESPEKIQSTIVDLVTQRLPKTYHYDPLADIQIISPMYKGEAGVTALNQLLQAKLNPLGDGVKIGYTIYSLGKTYNPLLYFTVLSFLSMGIGMLLGIYILWDRFMISPPIDHIPLTILATLLIIFGLQIFIFGYLIDMIFLSQREMLREIRKS